MPIKKGTPQHVKYEYFIMNIDTVTKDKTR